MLAKFRGHLRSHVVAYVALFAALSTGAYAAVQIPRNSVNSGTVKNNSLRSADLRNNTVTGKDVNERKLACQKIPNCLGDGPGGPAGPAGPPGPQGTPGAPSWSADCNEGLAANDVMVRVGSVCVDKYEASIWDAPTGGSQITGAIPCNANGQDCDNIYARSVAGVAPRANITWFQAQAALANSGKRLPTNAEWQMAVRGTPDTTDCNVGTFSLANTGANANCVSDFGNFDMVGNLWEWVADWVPQADGCDNWPAGFGSDLTCFGDDSNSGGTSRFPGALIRGGSFNDAAGGGPFAVLADVQPSSSSCCIAFRGAR